MPLDPPPAVAAALEALDGCAEFLGPYNLSLADEVRAAAAGLRAWAAEGRKTCERAAQVPIPRAALDALAVPDLPDPVNPEDDDL